MKRCLGLGILFCIMSTLLLNGCGGSSSESHGYFVETFVGVALDSGHVNGTRDVARLDLPRGLCFDSAGNLLIADSGYIRKITPAGSVTDIAGDRLSGYGEGTPGSFNIPFGIALDTGDNVYIADCFNHLIRKIVQGSPNVVSTLAGGTPPPISGSTDSPPRFNQPGGLVFRSGYLYVADGNNNSVRRIDTRDGSTTTIISTGILAPYDVAFDSAGNLYVADTGNRQIKKYTLSGGSYTLSMVIGDGTPGHQDGPAATARFQFPTGLAVDSAGNVYVVDEDDNSIRLIRPDGNVSTIAGQAGVAGHLDGPGLTATFNRPFDVAIGPLNTLFVTDRNNSTIRKISYR